MAWKYFKQAISFLSVIPVQFNETFLPGDLGRAAMWYPLVGGLFGLGLCIVRLLFLRVFPDPLGAVAVVALWAGVTGGLHLDGLADCCDGLLASAPPERRLEIMRDPRLGSFAGIGLALFLALKVSAVMAAQAGMSWASVYGLLLAPVLARSMILLAVRQPMARPGGLGAEFAAGVTNRTYMLAAILPLVLVGLGGLRAITAAVLAFIAAWGVIHLARSRLGGLTGDVLGLMIELSELAVLLVYAAGFLPGWGWWF